MIVGWLNHQKKLAADPLKQIVGMSDKCRWIQSEGYAVTQSLTFRVLGIDVTR
jgi:hypothetical protein